MVQLHVRVLVGSADKVNTSKKYADVTQLVECNLAKVDVAGSSPVIRSTVKLVSKHTDQLHLFWDVHWR